jgi:hypothetical protein
MLDFFILSRFLTEESRLIPDTREIGSIIVLDEIKLTTPSPISPLSRR